LPTLRTLGGGEAAQTLMDRTLGAALATIVVGALIALQAPINSGLGKVSGTLPAAAISFMVGTLLLLAIVVVSGEVGSLAKATDVKWYYLIGGVLGAAYVTTVLLTVRTLGAGGVTAATVAGQLTMSVVIDRLGFLGLDETPITLTRVTGVLLLFAGTLLVIRT
jgi:bacterial/archaeal transporter family-2 protein